MSKSNSLTGPYELQSRSLIVKDQAFQGMMYALARWLF